MNFSYARDLVAATSDVHDLYPNGFTLADYGWENPSSFLIVVDEPQLWDAPTIFVDKKTSAVSLIYGLNVSGDPTAGMNPVGPMPA